MGYPANTVANLAIILPKLPPTKKKKIKQKMHKGMQDFERVTSSEEHIRSGEFCKNKGFAFL